MNYENGIHIIRDFVRANYDVLMELATDDTVKYEDLSPFLVFPSDLDTMIYDEKPIINIIVTDGEDELLIITDGNKYGKEFIKRLIEKPQFQPYEENIARIYAYHFVGDAASVSARLKDTLYGVAKSIGCKINFAKTAYLETQIAKLMKKFGK